MSSFTHELLVMLVGHTPHMLRALLGKHLVASATRIRFRRSDATVSQVPPLGCGLCIELYRGRSTKPFLVLIIEVQLGLNRKKPFSWFAYQACQHYRTRAPALLVVITNDRKVGRWAAGPFCSGQTTLRPLGKEMEMELRILVSENWRPRSDWGKDLYAKGETKGRTEGAAEAKAASVITVLEHRGLPVSPALRERVTHTTDLALLERWLRRAITASTVEEAFSP